MDEGNNPFLAQPGETRFPGPKMDETQPVIAYVFRGAKKYFANPFFPSDVRIREAELDPADEDFEPHPCPPPRLLWPKGPAKRRVPAIDEMGESTRPSSPISTPTTKRRFLSLDGEEAPSIQTPKRLFSEETLDAGSGDEEEDEEEPSARRGLLFGPGKMGEADKAETGGGAARKSKKPRVLRL